MSHHNSRPLRTGQSVRRFAWIAFAVAFALLALALPMHMAQAAFKSSIPDGPVVELEPAAVALSASAGEGVFQVKQVPLAPYNVICIYNTYSGRLKYWYRWGAEDWRFTYVDGYSWRQHMWTIGDRVAPSFEVRFDSDFTTENLYKRYALLAMNTFFTDCESGYEYQFEVRGNYLDLYDVE